MAVGVEKSLLTKMIAIGPVEQIGVRSCGGLVAMASRR